MTLREAAERVGGWVAPEDHEKRILRVASLADAGEGDISFYGNPRYLNAARKCGATAILVPHGFGEELPATRIWVDNPAAAFAVLLKEFAPPPVEWAAGVHSAAVVSPDAEIDESASIQPFAVVEAGARIGAGSVVGAHSYVGHGAVVGQHCHIYPHVTIRERSVLGDRVVLHSGVVVGSDGFGFEFRDGRQQKIPQTGIVQIDNDVEVGANSTIDRARFGRTWIQEGVKIDNLVQIAHNVTVGKHSIICAQVGISGSTRIGDFVTLAGKVGVNGHIEIGNGAIATAMAAITKTVPPGQVLVGIPAKPMKEYKENYVLLRNIRKLYDRVQAIEEEARKAGS